MGTLIQLILLTLSVGLASAKFDLFRNDDGSICSTECTNEGIGNNVVFAENRKYAYDFHGETKIMTPTESSEGQTKVSIKGNVKIIGTKNCGAILYLKNVEITQGSENYINTKLEGNPILFSYNNGKIGQKICSSEYDSDDSLNLKRALISALQVSSLQDDNNELYETDIQGTCITSYYASSLDRSRTILKVKDLTRCTGHDKINLFGQSPTPSSPAKGDSPFSEAVQQSKIIIIESSINSVSNQETFNYQPFGALDVATKMEVFMNLKLTKISMVKSPSLKLNKARSIIFNKSNSMIKQTNMDELIKAVHLATNNLEPIVKMDGAKYFTDLIELLKVANKDDILSLFQLIKSGTSFENTEVIERVFIDALIAANSGESIEAVIQLIASNKLSDSLVISYFTNLAKAKFPTKEALVSASNLLNTRELKKGYMPIGTLLQTYLRSTQDYDSLEVKKTLENLGVPLKKAFSNSLSSDDENLVIASLKGLGNVQYINDDIENLIVQIIVDKNVIPRIRAAALSMIKVYAKNSQLENACENIFTDTSEDSEIRILAFKVFSINPSQKKASVIKNVLDDKKCQLQIRTFLLSYINTLQTTVDENKLDQKRFYGGIKPMSSRKMISDILRYSQNLEYSYQCPMLHSGAMLNGDIIYSYNSFIARSSSITLKALMFGRKYDILDFDIRIENIESILKSLFGPEGLLTKNDDHVYDNIKNYVNQVISYAKNRKLNKENSELSPDTNYENASDEDTNKIYIDIGIKSFGNDIGWFDFQGQKCQITYKHIIDTILNHFDSSVPNDENLQMVVQKQMPIIDYEKKYATSSGLPITLQIQAMSAFKLDLATKFDLETYLSHPENSNYILKLIPSGSISFKSLLTVDGHAVEAGYKIESSLHSSMGSDFSLKTVQGRGFEIKQGLPLDDMDILSIKSGAFKIVQEKERPIVEIPLMNTDIERSTYTRNFEHLVNSIGLSFSVNYNIPWNGNYNSLLPFSGPSSLSLKILKIDEKLTDYVMRGIYEFESSNKKYIKFTFGTPKTDINRNIELFVGIENNYSNSTFLTKFITPSSQIVLQNTLINTDDQKTIYIQYSDGSQHIFNMGVKCEAIDNETIKYSPIFETTYFDEITHTSQEHPLLQNFNIEGSIYVKYNNENKYPSKITLKDIDVNIAKSKHSLQGSLTYENNDIKGDASLTTNGIDINMNGFISKNYPNYITGGTFNIVRNIQKEKPLLLIDENDENDDYEPTSKIIDLLNKFKILNISMYHELNMESPYMFLSNNHLIYDNDYFDLNGKFLIKNDELTIHGNISTSNIFDLILNGNITILPSTEDSGILALGFLQHSFVSDSLNSGMGNFKYVQDKDKSGGYLELNSECPLLGVFNFNTQHRLTDELFKYNLNYYNIEDEKNLKIAMNVITDSITFVAKYDSLNNPDHKTFITIRGRSEKSNTYLLDTNMLWPGSKNENYLKARGNVFLNGLNSEINGILDFPSANLKNAQLSLRSTPISGIKDEAIAIVQCVSNDKVLLDKKFKYKLILNNAAELYLSGKIIDENSQNSTPMNFVFEFKNYKDDKSNNGKELVYIVELLYNGQKRLYQKHIKFTKQMLTYNQIHKVDDNELKIDAHLEYYIKDYSNWYYSINSNMTTPRIFHYFMQENQDYLEFRSHVKFNDYSLDKLHSLQIYASENLDESYELRYFINSKKSMYKVSYGQREIRSLAHYNLEPIEGGYHLHCTGELWLDYNTDPNSETILSLNTYYSLNDGLSTAIDFNVLVPVFNEKEMGLKTDIQIFKSWEVPIDVLLELNIFPTTEQTLELHTRFNRNIQENGVLYSAELLMKSDGMDLDYSVKDSLFISKEKWGKYFDAMFIDSDNIQRPFQIYFELVPRGFTNKLNIFDIAVINVDTSLNVKDGILNTRSIINYNKHPYSLDISLKTNPSFKYILEWTDKMENLEKLVLEGSIVMDDSAIISATHIKNNEIMPVGSITKDLTETNWWATDNEMNSQQWKLIWQSLKGEFIGRFIDIHNNLKAIKLILFKERKLRSSEAKKAKPQIYTLVKYARDEWDQILDEVLNDDYILRMPTLLLNCVKATMVGGIDFIEYIKLKDSLRSLGHNIENYSNNMYNYYSEQTYLLLNNIKRRYDELLTQVELTLQDLYYNMLNEYTDKPVDEILSEPHSLKDYINDIIKISIKKIKELKNIIDRIKDISVDYITSLKIYDTFHDEIEKLKSYPFKDKLYEEIHNYLYELEVTAPTEDVASFIRALNKYINDVIYGNPISREERINLRNKGLIAANSMLTNFSNYIDYNKAMTIYNYLNKLTNFGKTILYIASPNLFQHSSNENHIWYDFSEYMNFYRQLTIPPFEAKGTIIDSNNIITFNKQPYSMTPYTGSYILANDFKNNKFSILANYEENVLTSISLSSYNSETYELHFGGRVTIKGKNVNFPLIVNNDKIWKDVNYFGIDSSVGVSIKCALNFDFIIVLINGYYHGQVFGLLGSMYQEPSLDFNLPNGKASDDLESFVSAYHVAGDTKPTINDLVLLNQQLCANLFSGISTLKEVFSIISPTAYRVICNHIVSSATSQEDRFNKACLVAKAYVSMARQNHVSNCIIPEMCITTKAYGQSLNARSNVEISDKSNVADIILLFDDTNNQRPFSKVLNPLMNNIMKNFIHKEISDVNFIIIGYSETYGNSDVQMYTINKDNNNYESTSNSVAERSISQTKTLDEDTNEFSSNIMQSFNFSKIVQSFKKITGMQSKDKAFKIAAEYPFRANALKAVVCFPQTLYNNNNQSYSLDLSLYNFNYITSCFVEQAIKFYLIAPINMSHQSENGIFGADGMNTIYTLSAPNGKLSESEYTYDKSIETEMVLKTHGVMYDSQAFVKGDVNQRKTFLKSLCKSIVNQTVKDSIVSKRCTSSVYDGVMPFVRCTVMS